MGQPKAVVLLSGGLDSTSCAAWAKVQGYEVCALTINYGQRHRVELAQAARVCTVLGIAEHRVVQLDLASIGGSALTANIDVPKGRSIEAMQAIPVTYVPARNATFLSIALGYAEVVGAVDVVIGVNAVDYSGYPDCRPEFIAAFERMAQLATKAGVEGRAFKVHAPLSGLTKADIIRQGLAWGAPLELTHSCYDPIGDLACGACDSCILRRDGFRAAGVADPTRYV